MISIALNGSSDDEIKKAVECVFNLAAHCKSCAEYYDSLAKMCATYYVLLEDKKDRMAVLDFLSRAGNDDDEDAWPYELQRMIYLKLALHYKWKLEQKVES